MFYRFKMLYVITFFVSLLTVGGVYATWTYSDGPAADVSNNNMVMNLTEWYYETNLPGGGEDGEDDFNEGYSHADLIRDIINDIKKDNPNTTTIESDIKSALDDCIVLEQNNGSTKDHDGIGSSVKYGAGNIRDFAGSRGYENVGFFIYYGPGITDISQVTSMEIYTFSLSDSAYSIGRYITVYKTTITFQDGEWIIRGGYEGTAAIEKYGNSNTVGKYKNVIDPDTWMRVTE